MIALGQKRQKKNSGPSLVVIDSSWWCRLLLIEWVHRGSRSILLVTFFETTSMITSIFANEAAGASLYGFYSRLIVEDVPRNGSGQPSPDLTALNLAILKVFKSLHLIDRVPI